MRRGFDDALRQDLQRELQASSSSAILAAGTALSEKVSKEESRIDEGEEWENGMRDCLDTLVGPDTEV